MVSPFSFFLLINGLSSYLILGVGSLIYLWTPDGRRDNDDDNDNDNDDDDDDDNDNDNDDGS